MERHKSRLASRETGDGLTGTHSGGSVDRTETVPKWPQERRARAGLRETLDGTKPCARETLTFPMPPFPPEVDSFRFFKDCMAFFALRNQFHSFQV